MRWTAVLVLIGGVAVAQENPLPLTRADGGMCFYDVTCSGPWHELVSRGETGWYCEADEQFCRTEGRGQSCACSKGRQSGWTDTGRISGQASSGIDYEAEIVEHVVDACYLDGIRRRDDAELFGSEQEALEIVKLLNAGPIQQMIEAVLPLVAGQDRETRMAIYEFGAATCARAARDAAGQ